MEGLAAVVVVTTIASVIYLIQWSTASARASLWRRSAVAAGLTDISVSQRLGIETSLSGIAGGLPVRLEPLARGEHGDGIRVCIGGLQHRPFELAFRREDLGTAFSKAIGERDIEIGDAAFDESVYLGGSPAVAHAVLDADVRLLVLRLLQGRIQVPGSVASLGFDGRAWLSDGWLYAEISERGLGAARDTLSEVVRGLLAVAHKLVRPADIALRLAENSHREPLASVRLANLNALVREYPGTPATVAALRAAVDDRDDEVRFRAAIALGDEGTPVLLEIASRVEDNEERAAEAVASLGGQLPASRGTAILADALKARRIGVAKACVASLGRVGGSEAAESVGRVLALEGGELAIAAAAALGTIGGPTAERALLKALVRADAAVRVAAAEALGRAGTVAAVMPLREAGARHGGALSRATRQAIAEIQARLAGASAGQLSLALGEDGRLSLAPEGEHAGELSLPDPPNPADSGSAEAEEDDRD